MTLEQLVTDLATSQRLKDAGFPQDTAMVWVPTEEFDEYEVGENREPVLMERIETIDEDGEPMYEFCAAPTAGELEEWLLERGTIEYIMSAESEVGIAYSPNKRVNNCRNSRAQTLVAALAALVLEVAG